MRSKHFIQQHVTVMLLTCCCLWMIVSVYVLHNWELAPRCIVRSLCGYDCPMCGIQRMIYCAIQGRFREAFWCNPYIAMVSPYLFSVITVSLLGHRAPRLKAVVEKPYVVAFFGVMMVAWSFIRNTIYFL